MSANSDELATNANTVTIMVGSFLNMDQMVPSGVVPSLVANGGIGLDALDYDMADTTYRSSYENDLVTQLAGAWKGSGSGTQEMSEYSGISAGTLALTNTTGATIDVAAQGALFTATDGKTYETEEQPTNAAWSNGTSQTGSGTYVIAPGQTVTVPIEATFQGDDAASDAAGSITTSAVAGLTVSQASALAPGSTSTNPADNNSSDWLTNDFGDYSFVFTNQGLAPAEAHVNVNAQISWTATDVASWKGYVDNARSVGILNVAPLESGALPQEDPTQPFATSAFYAGFRTAALYGGGLEIELPSYYWFRLTPSEQQTVIEEIRWCNADGIRSSILVNNQTDFAGDPDPNFATDTVTMLRQLQAEGALPSQVVLENDNTTAIGSFYDTSVTDLNSLNAVALDLAADFSFTPSASEDGLEVRGTSTAQTTLIMSGVKPSEDLASGSIAPYAITQIFSEDPTETLTLTVGDTSGLLTLTDSLDAASAKAGGTLSFTGTAAQATTFLADLQATASAGTIGVADLTLTLKDSLGETTEGVTAISVGHVHPTFTAVTETASASGALSAGARVTFTLATSARVTVAGAPTLLLTNERSASYAGQDGAGDLVFSYTVAAGDDTATLRVRGLRLDGASITDSSTGLAIDPDSIDGPEAAMTSALPITTSTDTIVSVTEVASSSGSLKAGAAVTFLLAANDPISAVTGAPTLSLNNGAIATFTGLTSAGQMQFTTTIPSGSIFNNLAPTALNMNGATVTNNAGKAVLAPTTLPTPATELSYNTATDTIVGVTEAAASGALTAGSRMTFLLSAAKPISAVVGAPTLVLNNGAIAIYAGLTSAGQMEFTTTVPPGSAFSNLAPTALDLNGATVTNNAGTNVTAPATLPVSSVKLSYNTTTDAIAGVTESASAAGTLAAGDRITFLLSAGKPIATVAGAPSLSLNDGGTATYAGLTGAGQMEFAYTVPSGSYRSLAATSLNLAGAVVTDDVGATVYAPAKLPLPSAELSYGTTTTPVTTTAATTTTTTTTTAATTSQALATTDTTSSVSAPSTVVTLVDDVPVTVPSGLQIGTPTPLSGQAASFSDGAGIGIVDPSGNAETLAHLYQAVLGRAPDIGGLEGWINHVDSGAISIAAAAADIVGSAEFTSRFGSLTDAQFVNVLAENTTGSAATAADQDYVDALDAGTSRGTVAMQFAESAANVVNALGTSGDTGYGEVYRIYETTLGRAPDPTGLPGYLEQLQGGTSLASIVQNFINSAEFQSNYGTMSNSQFVTVLYRSGLARTPDAMGLQTWVNALNNGASRATVVLAISDSLESRMDTAPATHDNWVYIAS